MFIYVLAEEWNQSDPYGGVTGAFVSEDVAKLAQADAIRDYIQEGKHPYGHEMEMPCADCAQNPCKESCGTCNYPDECAWDVDVHLETIELIGAINE